MNGWSGHKAMIGNKRALLVFLLALIPCAAHAQGAAPGMFKVKEIIIQYVRFSDPKVADACGLSREDIAKTLAQDVKLANVPAFSIADSTPPEFGVARITLVPEISSVTNHELECTSWISLTAESQTNTIVPPIETLRSVKVVYWRQGTMAVSNQSVHAHLIADTLDKMVAQFAQQYHTEQPPDVK
jgi:hypothetical protein